MIGPDRMEYHIRQYELQQGALEIEYIEEYFGEFKRKKTANEVVGRLGSRDHQIVMAEAPLPDDPGTVVPVAQVGRLATNCSHGITEAVARMTTTYISPPAKMDQTISRRPRLGEKSNSSAAWGNVSKPT